MADSSGSSFDPNQVIQNAIESVLGQNGTGSSTGSTDASGDGQSSAATTGSDQSSSSTTGQSSFQAFSQLLSQNGVDASQFQQDLLAAVQNSSGGQFDAASAFQNFPPGSVVNQVA